VCGGGGGGGWGLQARVERLGAAESKLKQAIKLKKEINKTAASIKLQQATKLKAGVRTGVAATQQQLDCAGGGMGLVLLLLLLLLHAVR